MKLGLHLWLLTQTLYKSVVLERESAVIMARIQWSVSTMSGHAAHRRHSTRTVETRRIISQGRDKFILIVTIEEICRNVYCIAETSTSVFGYAQAFLNKTPPVWRQ